MEPRRRGSGRIGVLAIAATYVGAVVGAGFASGQEVLQFFTHFGWRGLVGLPLAAVLFAACGAAIMLESRWSRALTHRGVLEWLGGPWFAGVYDFVITVFLFGVLAVMVAGSGALFQEQLGWPALLGGAVMALASVLTVVAGLRGVVAASEVVVPFLLIAVSGVAAAALSARVPAGAAGSELARVATGAPWLQWWRPEEAAVPWWPLASLLYVSYNLVLSPAVLSPLAARARGDREVIVGGVVGGLALGAAATGVNLALLATLPASAAFEVPMLHVAGEVSGRLGWLASPAYGAVLWAEIYTTAVGVLYGLALRLAGQGVSHTPGVPSARGRGEGPSRTGEGPVFRRWAVCCGAAALVAARAGFSEMVASLYPAAGYAGLLLLAAFLLRLWRQPGPGRPPGRRAPPEQPPG